MGDIGTDPKEYEFEPIGIPEEAPVKEPAAPAPAPAEPVREPEKVPA